MSSYAVSSSGTTVIFTITATTSCYFWAYVKGADDVDEYNWSDPVYISAGDTDYIFVSGAPVGTYKVNVRYNSKNTSQGATLIGAKSVTVKEEGYPIIGDISLGTDSGYTSIKVRLEGLSSSYPYTGHKVTYTINGKSYGPYSISKGATQTSYVTISDLEDGYQYYLSAEITGLKDSNGDTYTENIATYVWTQAYPTRTLTLYKNDGTSTSKVYTKKTTSGVVTMNLPTIASLEWTNGDKIFTGWAETKDGEAIYQDGQSYWYNVNTSLYAVWSQGSQISIYVNKQWRNAVPYVYKGNGIWGQANTWTRIGNKWG